MPKKTGHKKLYVAIILIAILVVATAAIVYGTTLSKPTSIVGVHVGDTFTYRITGTSVLNSAAAVTPAGFDVYNQTDHYTVTVTGVVGTKVSLDTVWLFLNGTQITSSQTIDLATGNKTDPNGFWPLYPSNLKTGDLLYPKGTDGQIVNATDTLTYANNSTRGRNYWYIENLFKDINDPTGNTQRDEYDSVYFDQQTGMLIVLNNVQYYNNPEYALIVTWQLISSNVWTVT